MDLNNLSEYENEYVKLSVREKIFILRLEGHIYNLLNSLSQSHAVIECINGLRSQPDIAALLIISNRQFNRIFH